MATGRVARRRQAQEVGMPDDFSDTRERGGRGIGYSPISNGSAVGTSTARATQTELWQRRTERIAVQTHESGPGVDFGLAYWRT